MKKFVISLLCVFQCLLYTRINASSVTAEVGITTNYGKVKGIKVDYENGNGIDVFMGIPFAEPPVGELRFKAPVRPKPWTNEYDATYYRSSCTIIGMLAANRSEDCLYLNVHRPYKGAGLGDGPFPVMFWIHGGGYNIGSGSFQSGHYLAQKGVVVVTCNYRLHALGFLTTEDDVAPGNYGLLDQQAALQYVRENIAAFGGDPDDITIFGLSAGATSVSLHLFSPKSMPMYKRAIMQSGADSAPWAIIRPEFKPSDYARHLAEDLGCPTANSSAMVACLRELPAADIAESALYVLADIKDGGIHFPWSPVVDGAGGFLPDTPANLRQRGEFAKVPIIIGVTSHETGVLPLKELVTRQEFLDNISNLTDSVRLNNTQQQNDALSFEYTPWPDVNNGTSNRKEFLNIMSDVLFNSPMDMTAKHQSEYNDVYTYVFRYSSINHPDPKYMAVAHSEDVPYMFGYPLFDKTMIEITNKTLHVNYTDEDREFSEYIMTLWSNFAKHGNPTPSPVGGVTWVKFNQTNMQHMSLGRDPQNILNYRQHKCAFVREYIQKVIDYRICEKDKRAAAREEKRKKSTKLRKSVERYNRSQKMYFFLKTLYNGQV